MSANSGEPSSIGSRACLSSSAGSTRPRYSRHDQSVSAGPTVNASPNTPRRTIIDAHVAGTVHCLACASQRAPGTCLTNVFWFQTV